MKLCKFAKTLKNIFFSGRRSVLKILSVFFFDLKKLPILSFSSPINGLRKEKDWICWRGLNTKSFTVVRKLCYSDMLIRYIKFSYHYILLFFFKHNLVSLNSNEHYLQLCVQITVSSETLNSIMPSRVVIRG